MLRKASRVGSKVIPRFFSRLGRPVFRNLVLGLTCVFAITALAFVPFVPWVSLAALLAVLPALILASAFDLVTRRIPDCATAWITVVGGVHLTYLPSPLPHLLTALIAGTLLWLGSEIWFRLKGSEALGLGDVKLISAAALVIGPVGLWAMIVTASLGGIVFAMLRRNQRAVPFGPFLSYGMILGFGFMIWVKEHVIG